MSFDNWRKQYEGFWARPIQNEQDCRAAHDAGRAEAAKEIIGVSHDGLPCEFTEGACFRRGCRMNDTCIARDLCGRSAGAVAA